jgi:hypothetical protein
MTHKIKNIMSKIPQPQVKHIKLLKVESVFVPHPYCITPRHLTGKSIYLNEETIRDAEKNNNAVCDICRKLVKAGRQKNIMSFDEHQKALTLFIEVPDNEDLNSVPDLHEYLLKIKPVLIKYGIDGIAFKKAGERSE